MIFRTTFFITKHSFFLKPQIKLIIKISLIIFLTIKLVFFFNSIILFNYNEPHFIIKTLIDNYESKQTKNFCLKRDNTRITKAQLRYNISSFKRKMHQIGPYPNLPRYKNVIFKSTPAGKYLDFRVNRHPDGNEIRLRLPTGPRTIEKEGCTKSNVRENTEIEPRHCPTHLFLFICRVIAYLTYGGLFFGRFLHWVCLFPEHVVSV